jgi:addiction module RelE/StbE family toxin
MAHLNWTDQALADLVSIAGFIAKDSVRYARITITKIRIVARQLQSHPLSGRKVPEANNETIRELVFGNYRIIYSLVSSERIDILPVHHSAKPIAIDELKRRIR